MRKGRNQELESLESTLVANTGSGFYATIKLP